LPATTRQGRRCASMQSLPVQGSPIWRSEHARKLLVVTSLTFPNDQT